MSRDGTKNAKSYMNEQAAKKVPSKPKGRSFCCSMFVYTFVFVSGVVVATILPDLVGHHFKQPYGKEYGVMVEQVFKDLPKHLNRLSETAVVLGRDLANRPKQNQLLNVQQLGQQLVPVLNDPISKSNDRPCRINAF
ncbi:unnamed protein product [Rotaria socialis]